MKIKRIDRGSSSWPKDKGYWLFFLARPLNISAGSFAHAFVVWGVRNRETRTWATYEGLGLYPTKSSKIFLGSVPGKIVLESIQSLAGANLGLAVGVTKQMYDYTHKNSKILSRYPDIYDLLNHNCVHFIDVVARALSLKTPPISQIEISLNADPLQADELLTINIHPIAYLQKLTELNS